MEYALFLGCIVPLRYPDIEKAVRLVMEMLDVKLYDLEKATCCPVSGCYYSFDHVSTYAVAARNIVLAENLEKDIMTICNGCFATLFKSNKKIKENKDLKNEINNILSVVNMNYKGTVDIKHFVQVLYQDIGCDKIKQHVINPLTDLKVAVHYGCHLLRPKRVFNLDDPESPHIFDEIVTSLGAKSIDYKLKKICCGAGGGLRANNPELSFKIMRKKLQNIRESDADAIVSACPFCHLQFDRGQFELNKKGEEFNIPVVHLAQLMGLAMGISEKKILTISETSRKKLVEAIKV